MADVLDILDVNRGSDALIQAEKKQLKKKKLSEQKKPNVKGLNREVYALLASDNKDSASLIPTDFAITSKFGVIPYGYKKVKANLSLRRVIKWSWVPFTNPARKDGFQLYHWRREADRNKEYPFAKMNMIVNVPTYTDQEYQQFLQHNDWTKQETDYLFQMCKKFDLRFIIIHDRWDSTTYKERTVEGLKDRYYSACDALSKQKSEIQVPTSSNTATIVKHSYVFDAEHERKRKEQLKKLYNRTPEEVEEEQQLIAELRKIEQRKKEREKKTQDLQKLITAADTTSELRRHDLQQQTNRGTGVIAVTPPVGGPRSSRKKSSAPETAGIKFPDFKAPGVYLRSSRMKVPSSIGQKRIKAIGQLLREFGIESYPMPTESICKHFNDIRSDIVLLYELKLAQSNLDYDLQSLKHQLEAINNNSYSGIPQPTSAAIQSPASVPSTPLSAVSLPDNMTSTFGLPNKEASVSSFKKISEVFDVGNTTPRKRKAAIEQVNLMRKLRKN